MKTKYALVVAAVIVAAITAKAACSDSNSTCEAENSKSCDINSTAVNCGPTSDPKSCQCNKNERDMCVCAVYNG